MLVAGDARSVNRPAKYAVSAIVTSIRSKTVANDDTAKKRECLPRGPTPPSTRTRTQRTHPSLAPEAQDNATRKRERELSAATGVRKETELASSQEANRGEVLIV